MNHGDLLNALPTRPLREVLLRAVGGVLANGSPDSALVAAVKTQLETVGLLAYHLFRSPQQYVCTLLTAQALVRFEVYPDGTHSIRVVPLRQVRQVSEQKGLLEGKVVHEIVVEFNAGVTETVPMDNGTVSKPGGWVLTPELTPDGVKTQTSAEQMVLFGSQLRHRLASTPL